MLNGIYLTGGSFLRQMSIEAIQNNLRMQAYLASQFIPNFISTIDFVN
ncbi:hypothetical protein ACKFKF_07685 [Phormidesmis sp. 146-12]